MVSGGGEKSQWHRITAGIARTGIKMVGINGT